MKKIPLIILTGPTAVGKTDLSIKLSKSLNAEIISADSMQIYKYMDIGSAKVTKEEMDGVVHYMIDEVTPDVPFSVSEFQMRSEKYIEEINKKGKSVLITGGTGLYLNSLIYNMDFAKSNANNEIREKEASANKLKTNPKAKKIKAKEVEKSITKIYLNGGKKKKIRAGDIVGAISRIEGVNSEDIGIIDVQDIASYVDILNGKGNKVLNALKDMTIKGKKLRVERAKK